MYDLFYVFISEPVLICVEPAGRWYEAICTRKHHKHSQSYHSESSSSSDEDDQKVDEVEDNESLLLGLDPKEWKVSVQKYKN